MIELITNMSGLDFAMIIAGGLSVWCMWGLFR